MDKEKRRLVLLDILKIVFALFVFIRHSATMGGCHYKLFDVNYLRSVNNVMMSAFFTISGFSLYYVYKDKNLFSIKDTIMFYKKRAISIIPIYLFVAICYFVFFDSTIKTNLGLLPIEALGIHTFFNNTFDFLHNGTTWFVSCLILSYFLYPLLQEIIKYLSKRKKAIVLIVLILFLSYTPFMFKEFSITGTYSNPLLRTMEFSLGMFICSLINFDNIKVNKYVCLLSYVVLFSLIFLAGKYSILSYLKYILISLIILVCAMYKTSVNRKFNVINFLANLCYPFYILQVFIWKKYGWFNSMIVGIKNNYLRVFVFFCVLFVSSILITYLYQKPISKILKKNKKIFNG